MPAKATPKNTSRPIAPKQQPPPIQNFQFTADDFKNPSRLNVMMQQLVTAVQALQGSGGRTALFSGIDVQGETVTGLGTPQNETDAVSLGHAQGSYSAPVIGPQLDLGGSNALKGLSLLQLNSNDQGNAIAAIQALLAAAASGTVTLAKLTNAGTTGSITFSSGLITGVVDPT
jgi:hypothetical protein